MNVMMFCLGLFTACCGAYQYIVNWPEPWPECVAGALMLVSGLMLMSVAL